MPLRHRIENSLRWRLIRGLVPASIGRQQFASSLAFSPYDEASQPSERLLTLAFETIQRARTISLEDISARMASPPFYPDLWPGEHYKLLAALVGVLKPRRVIEIGTGTGLSAVTMLKYLPPDAQLITFDVVDWRSFPGGVLRQQDFQDGRLTQYLDDVTIVDGFRNYQDRFCEADLLFVDAEKDGFMEQRIVRNLESIRCSSPPIVMFDDIRLWNMLQIWPDIPRPKLDLTSFGHWSGTGWVDWQ